MSTTIDKPRTKTKLDTGRHDRRLARRLKEDPEFAAEFQRQQREIAAIDEIVHKLDALRAEKGITKAELARRINKNAAAVRRLLTASGNPELKTVVAMADALGVELRLEPKPSGSGENSGARRRTRQLLPA